MPIFAQVNPQIVIKARGVISLPREGAFTRIELLAVIAVCLVLVVVQIPLLGRSREPNNVAVCANNLRQLSAAMLMYSADNNDYLTQRGGGPRWPSQLLPYYRQTNVLHCPSDAPNPADFGTSVVSNYVGPRSYVLNGFDDYPGPKEPFGPPTLISLKGIKYPSDTVLFGEKDTASGHWWMDYNLGDDITEIEHARHLEGSSPAKKGGSNFSFVDGSVRFLKPGESYNPVMLWGVTDEYRNPYGPF